MQLPRWDSASSSTTFLSLLKPADNVQKAVINLHTGYFDGMAKYLRAFLTSTSYVAPAANQVGRFFIMLEIMFPVVM